MLFGVRLDVPTHGVWPCASPGVLSGVNRRGVRSRAVEFGMLPSAPGVLPCGKHVDVRSLCVAGPAGVMSVGQMRLRSGGCVPVEVDWSEKEPAAMTDVSLEAGVVELDMLDRGGDAQPVF